jgi:predicted ATPase
MLAQCHADKSKKVLAVDDIFGINLGLPSSIIAAESDFDEVAISAKINDSISRIVLKLQDAEEESLSFDIKESDFQEEIEVLYLNAERVGPRISSSIHESLGQYVGSKGENTNYVIHRMDLLGKTTPERSIHADLKISEINRFSANCESWLDLIIPGTRISTKTDYELNASTIKIGNKYGSYVPPATGFGISYTLPIIAQALAATTMKNPVLIVENPEAHLHPYSQSTLAKFLATVALCGVQVIIETHSEHIVNGCRLQLTKDGQPDLMSILFFSNDAEPTSINVAPNGELEHWPKGFFDQTKSDLRELLEMRRCGK